MPQPLSRAIRVFVAESSPISSQLMAEALARDSAIDVLGFSSEPAEIVRSLAASHTDVFLVSARLEEEPNRGLLLLRQLRKELPGLKAVVLLDSSKPEVVVQAFRSGACGVFSRNTAIRHLRKCVSAIHEGQVWASSEELRFVLSALASELPVQLDNKRLKPLSAREKEVVQCLVAGLTNRDIAEALKISQHTVKNYMFKIFEKLGVSNRVELVFQVLSQPSALGAIDVDSVRAGIPTTAMPLPVWDQLGTGAGARPTANLQSRSVTDHPKGVGLD